MFLFICICFCLGLVVAQSPDSNITVYQKTGNMTFNNTYVLIMCGNTTWDTCTALQLILGYVTLNVLNDFNDVFFIDQDLSNYYVSWFDQVVTDSFEIEIDSPGQTFMNYSYTALYQQLSQSPTIPADNYDDGNIFTIICIFLSVALLAVLAGSVIFIVIKKNIMACRLCGYRLADKCRDGPCGCLCDC
jgi:hypothetical protein